jgi:mannose-6-phosphate isomerase-like protein (cupin superfamily)
MKHPANRIKAEDQATPGVEGFVFDGADGSQMTFWTCGETAAAGTHTHEFDEYMVVIEGGYTLIVDGSRLELTAGEECFIPRGTPHSAEVVAGTRTIHAFGGKRVARSTA